MGIDVLHGRFHGFKNSHLICGRFPGKVDLETVQLGLGIMDYTADSRKATLLHPTILCPGGGGGGDPTKDPQLLRVCASSSSIRCWMNASTFRSSVIWKSTCSEFRHRSAYRTSKYSPSTNRPTVTVESVI